MLFLKTCCMVPKAAGRRLESNIGLRQTQEITCNSNVRLELVLQLFLKPSHMLLMPDLTSTAFPNASHPGPICLPNNVPILFLVLFPNRTLGGEAPYPSHTRFPSSSHSCTEAPKPSHPVLDGKCLGLVWEECFVIVAAVNSTCAW